MTAPCILHDPACLVRFLHIILKSKIHISVDRAATSNPFCYFGLRWPDRKPDGFPIPNSQRASWERLLGRIPFCCRLQFSTTQHVAKWKCFENLLWCRNNIPWWIFYGNIMFYLFLLSCFSCDVMRMNWYRSMMLLPEWCNVFLF